MWAPLTTFGIEKFVRFGTEVVSVSLATGDQSERTHWRVVSKKKKNCDSVERVLKSQS